MNDLLTLDLAHAALAAAFAVKAHAPGDHDDPHEDNTFGLPDGAPIRRRMRGFFREQLARVVGEVPTIGADLNQPLPRMGDWDDPMASAMTPIIGAYWDRAGKSLRARIGLDPAGWRVTDPNVHAAIKDQALTFCKHTNATTDLGIAAARDAVRDQLARGLIGRGETIPQLTGRIRTIFARASKSKAETIARTEASRAVHAASIMSAEKSGVVQGKRWLLSANSCPVCVSLAEKAGLQPLDGTFGTVGHSADYSTVKFPPAHPHCRCTIVYELIEEPPDHRPGRVREAEPSATTPSKPRRGPLVTPGRLVVAVVGTHAAAAAGRVAAREARRAYRRHRERVRRAAEGPPPAVPPAPGLIPPGPIADRIRAYMEGPGKAKLDRLAGLDATYRDDLAAVEKSRASLAKEVDKLRRKKGYAHAETAEAEARLKELSDRKDAYLDSTRRTAFRVAEALAVPLASRAVIATKMVTRGRAVPLVTREAEGFLGQVLAADHDNPAGLKVEYGALKKASDRAYYTDRDRRVNLNGQESADVVVHEFGHAVEHQWPKILQLSAEFLDHRVAGETIRRLVDIFPRRGYWKHERGRKDRFGLAFDSDAADAWYCGKEYRRKDRDPKTRWGTEILSMGVQKLMTDPVKFARMDPEYCAYVLGILDGSLR